MPNFDIVNGRLKKAMKGFKFGSHDLELSIKKEIDDMFAEGLLSIPPTYVNNRIEIQIQPEIRQIDIEVTMSFSDDD